jgi:putative tryptophan/tyrosine transport system substrate-binding protein
MKRRELVLLLGGTLTSARGLRAQQKTMSIVGYVGTNLTGPAYSDLAAFRQGLSDAGYVVGQNLTIEFHWAEGHYDRLPALAADLVNRKVDVIVVGGTPGIEAVKAATSTIPIVFFGGGDLVASGLVASLARPGGNLTGIGIFGRELNPKRLELLSELIPRAEMIALLLNPDRSDSEGVIRDVQEAARIIDRQLRILKASTDSEIDSAFATLAQPRTDGLVVAADPFFNSRREKLVALAARHAVPAIYEWREFAQAGGLISYGPSLSGTYRQVGDYVGRVLAGAKPADLPIQRPTRFELVINLTTAKALGLTIPQSVLNRADEVIE